MTVNAQRPPACIVVRSGEIYQGKQNLAYSGGVSAQSVEAGGICMNLLTVPPGGRAKPHLNENHETAIYMISGESGLWFGEGLGQHLIARAGDFVYIPSNVPHLPYNPSQTEDFTCVIARTDPNEQESVVLLPELE